MNPIDIIYTTALALLIVAAYVGLMAVLGWLKQSHAALEETRFGWLVEHLVQAAEEQIKGKGLGLAKFDWVIEQLDERVPNFDDDLARTIINAAVHRMNSQQGQWLTVPGELSETADGRGDQISRAQRP